jgi:glycosyltransferase involved in cell wall biosynthesis
MLHSSERLAYMGVHVKNENQILTVIIPCFNEENTLEQLLNSVAYQDIVKQIIVIDDCSTDNSFAIMNNFNDPRLLILKNNTNMGKGFSINRAIEYVEGSLVILQDADLEYDPSEYSSLAQPILSGLADVVYGSRFLPSKEKAVLYFWHKLGNNFLTFISNVFSNLALTDMETCYKMMRAEYFKMLEINEKRFGIEPEITAKLAIFGARFYEVSISYRGRTYKEGKKITWKDGFSALFCILKYNSIFQKRRLRKQQRLSFIENR